jgi:hypothetical protein
VVGWTHFAQFALQWDIKPRPEWFDHFLDQYWQWGATNNSLWVERGVFSRVILKKNSRMLEICCGDGFNTTHSTRARSISTRMQSPTPNDTIPRRTSPLSAGYPCCIAGGPFDTSCGMRRSSILPKRTRYHHGRDRRRLGPDGILSGYTLTEDKTGRAMPCTLNSRTRKICGASSRRARVGHGLSDPAQSVF